MLTGSLDKLVQSPAFGQQVLAIGLAPVMESTPQTFAQIMDAELDLYKTLVQAVRTVTGR